MSAALNTYEGRPPLDANRLDAGQVLDRLPRVRLRRRLYHHRAEIVALEERLVEVADQAQAAIVGLYLAEQEAMELKARNTELERQQRVLIAELSKLGVCCG
ncbi:MAG: hypothetical protein AAFV53_13090 [Myxococcota bacterium]